MKSFIKIFFVTAIVAIFAFSCGKQFDPDQVTGNDVRVADLAVSDVFTFSNRETDQGKSAFTSAVGYSKKVVDNGDGTSTTTLTFDPTFAFNDGIVRSGKIMITWQAGWRTDSTKKASVNFDNFSRDGNVLSGLVKFQLLSPDEPKYIFVEDNMSLTFKTSEKITWEGTRTVEWKAGFDTYSDRTDNVTKVNFTKSGVNRTGIAYTTTGVDLIMDNQCGQGKTKITAGTITNEKNGVTTIFNFGDGQCDDTFTITQNGITITINK